MKYTVLITFLIWTTFMLLPTQDVKAQGPMINFTETENLIDMTSQVMDGDEARSRRDLFSDRFRYGRNHDELNSTAAEVVMKAILDELYSITKKAIAKDPACTDKKCMAGLSLVLGMYQHEIILLYRPIYLRRTSILANKIHTFDTVHVGNVYRYANDAFQVVNEEPFTSEYRSNIQIRRFRNRRSYYNHNNDIGSWKADTKEVIYTMQEIVRFYESRHPSENDTNRYSSRLAFQNGSSFFEKSPPGLFTAGRAKHSIFITEPGFSFLSTERILVTAATDAADFAHLCPPGCTTSLKYQME
jgi:hypothetical protein